MSAADLWRLAVKAAPEGWTVQGLRCASTGLLPNERSERWVAEACGADGGCELVEAATPEAALGELARRLADIKPGPAGA